MKSKLIFFVSILFLFMSTFCFGVLDFDIDISEISFETVKDGIVIDNILIRAEKKLPYYIRTEPSIKENIYPAQTTILSKKKMRIDNFFVRNLVKESGYIAVDYSHLFKTNIFKDKISKYYYSQYFDIEFNTKSRQNKGLYKYSQRCKIPDDILAPSVYPGDIQKVIFDYLKKKYKKNIKFIFRDVYSNLEVNDVDFQLVHLSYKKNNSMKVIQDMLTDYGFEKIYNRPGSVGKLRNFMQSTTRYLQYWDPSDILYYTSDQYIHSEYYQSNNKSGISTIKLKPGSKHSFAVVSEILDQKIPFQYNIDGLGYTPVWYSKKAGINYLKFDDEPTKIQIKCTVPGYLAINEVIEIPNKDHIFEVKLHPIGSHINLQTLKPLDVNITNPELDIEQKLEKLKSLLEKGLISEEEFNSKKAELLNDF